MLQGAVAKILDSENIDRAEWLSSAQALLEREPAETGELLKLLEAPPYSPLKADSWTAGLSGRELNERLEETRRALFKALCEHQGPQVAERLLRGLREEESDRVVQTITYHLYKQKELLPRLPALLDEEASAHGSTLYAQRLRVAIREHNVPMDPTWLAGRGPLIRRWYDQLLAPLPSPPALEQEVARLCSNIEGDALGFRSVVRRLLAPAQDRDRPALLDRFGGEALRLARSASSQGARLLAVELCAALGVGREALRDAAASLPLSGALRDLLGLVPAQGPASVTPVLLGRAHVNNLDESFQELPLDAWKHFDPLASELLSNSGFRYSGPGVVLAIGDVPTYVGSLDVSKGNTRTISMALSWVPLRGRVDITSKKLRGGGPWGVHLYAEDLIIVGGPGMMRRRIEPEGKVRWSCELKGLPRLVGADERTQSLFVQSDREGLVCIDAESGAIRWWNHEVEPMLAVGERDRIHVFSSFAQIGAGVGRLHTLDLTSGKGLAVVELPPSHATDRLVLDAQGGLWLEDGTDYLGERLQSGLRLLPSGKLESHVRSYLDQTLVRHVAGVEVEVTSSYVRRGDRALSLPLDPQTPRPAWVRAGPAWGRRLLMRYGGDQLGSQPWKIVWHAVELDGLLS